MKRNVYGLVIAAVALALTAAFALRTLDGFALRPRAGVSVAADYTAGDYAGYVAPQSRRVTDERSARAAAAEIFGVEIDTLSAALQEDAPGTGEQFYKLQQMSGELPVYGRRANLSVDDGAVYLASGNLSGRTYDLDTTPGISADTAWESLYAYTQELLLQGEEYPETLLVYLHDFDEKNLCIYDQGEYEHDPRLAYDCSFTYTCGEEEPVCGSYDVLIDAHSAEVLSAVSNVYAATEALTYENSESIFQVELERSGDAYVFTDTARSLQAFNLDRQDIAFNWVNSDFYSWDRVQIQLDDGAQPYQIALGAQIGEDSVDSMAIRVLSHTQSTYDFYEEVLGRHGFNNGNGPMYLFFNHSNTRGVLGYCSWLGQTALLAFEWSTDLNPQSIVAHEFTHAVEQSISHMAYKGEAGALMEGYSDTFGVLAQGYTAAQGASGLWPASIEWTCAGRDLTTDPPEYLGDHPADSSQQEEGGWKYEYSYVVSNRAWRIWMGWESAAPELGFDEQLRDMARLFYRALYLLEHYASFDQWYWAMEQVAQYMLGSGELTQAQYEVVMGCLGSGRETSEGAAGSLDQVEAIAVRLAQEYERSGEAQLTDSVRELASISVIPEIQAELIGKTNLASMTAVALEYTPGAVDLMLEKTAMRTYLAALYGAEFADRFAADSSAWQYYSEYDPVYYGAQSDSAEAVCSGWQWKITSVEPLDDFSTAYTAALTSPEGKRYDLLFVLTQDAGEESGAFLNGHFLSDMRLWGTMELLPDDQETLLSQQLAYLVEAWGVIETGTQQYASQSGGFEQVIPDSRITGLLAAELDDYDGDGLRELLVVRVEPRMEAVSGYSVGASQQSHKTDVVLEVYDLRNGEVTCSGRTFPLTGFAETAYQTAAHVFKTTDEAGVRLYLDHFFNLNSQTYAVIQLEYDGETLRVTDGAELDEYAYGASCYQAVSSAACGTIIGRQSFDIGQDGWEECCSGYWDEYDEVFEEVTWNALHSYETLMRGMGLTEQQTRSLFWGDGDGGDYALLPPAYGRCFLTPEEHYACEGGTLEGVCSLAAPDDGYGSLTLRVMDETPLLSACRTGG